MPSPITITPANTTISNITYSQLPPPGDAQAYQCIAVTDANGYRPAFKRMDGAAPGYIEAVIKKANSASRAWLGPLLWQTTIMRMAFG
ncbi:heme-binding protein [Pseudomonas laurentiana]|nr:heme-binding protein [Pseudomonas putida]